MRTIKKHSLVLRKYIFIHIIDYQLILKNLNHHHFSCFWLVYVLIFSPKRHFTINRSKPTWYYKYKYGNRPDKGYAHKFRASHFVRHCRHQSDLLFAISSGRANYDPNRWDCWANNALSSLPRGNAVNAPGAYKNESARCGPVIYLESNGPGKTPFTYYGHIEYGPTAFDAPSLPQAVDANESWELNALYQDSGR